MTVQDFNEDAVMTKQVGGTHYKDMAIQPVTFIIANGLGFCVKKVDRVNLTKIRQKHILVREQYMFFINDELNFNGLIRFLWDVEMFDKIVYLPYFRETGRLTGSIHVGLWIEFQNFICENFENEFYFDYNLHKKNNLITAFRRQIALDDLV